MTTPDMVSRNDEDLMLDCAWTPERDHAEFSGIFNTRR